MLVRIRTRLVVSTVVTVALLVGLVVFLVVERLSFTDATARLADLEQSARRARELRLYVQSNIHSLLDYQLGHFDHPQDFTASTNAMVATLSTLEQGIAANQLDPQIETGLDRFSSLLSEHTVAARETFDAADRLRRDGSAEARADMSRQAKLAEDLGGQMDTQASVIAQMIDAQANRLRSQIGERYQWITWLVIGLGLVLTVLVVIIQLLGQRAIGQPLTELLAGVRQLSQGALDTRVPVRRQDELGVLAGAFNDMAARLQQQNERLRVQTAEAEAAQIDAETARNHATAQLEMIDQQREIIREMSVPILPLSRSTLVMPLIGAMDTDRLRRVQDEALHQIEQLAARYLILDITGIPVVDTAVAQGLIQVIEAAKLLGAEVVLVGIRPEIAQAMVGLGVDLGSVVTRSSLQGGIAYTSH